MIDEVFQVQLAAALKNYPDQTAIECGSLRITYSQLLQKANGIASVLSSAAKTGPKYVGILSADRAEIIYAITGISLAGAVFVPLDTNLPDERIMQMTEAVQLSAIITSREQLQRSGLKERLEDANITLLYFEEFSNYEKDKNYVIATSPDDPLYIYFTSGSTGRPKAIVGKNKSLLHFIQWEIGTFQIQPGSRFSQLVTPGFDAFLRDIYVPLFAGGTICVPADVKAVFNENTLANWINDSGIQYIHCVPSVFRLLNQSGLYKELKSVFLSGEKIRIADLQNWFDKYGERIQLVNFYGTTETTLISTYHLIKSTDTIVPIGEPIWDNEIKIIDDQLYIGSAYTSSGYLNEPELNQQKFIPQPDHKQKGFVLFKTGDKARSLENGNIELLGRIDRQLKLRGMRVEPEEIEQVLLKQTNVKDAVVELVEVNDQPVLSAFIILNNKKEIAEIEWELRELLPEYMIPSRFIILDEFPRKPNGKIDYSELKKSVQAESLEKAVPVTEEEKQLYSLWSAIIRSDNFSTHDTFFEVGGNSFHLINLVAKVHAHFKVRLSIQEIFLYNTIEKLAAYIAGKTEKKEIVIPVAAKQDFYSLTAGQFQIYQQQQLNLSSTAYNLPQFFVIEGKLDVKKMQEAFQKLTEIHSMLRTGFALQNDEPVQFIKDAVIVNAVYHEYLSWTPKEEQRYIQNFIKPFDLSRPALLRAEIIKRDKNCHLLLIDVHHIIADGVSQKILNRDLLRLYAGKEIRVNKLEYKDFSEWQNKERNEGEFEKQKKYWMNRLASPPILIPLPTDYSSYDSLNTEGAVFDFLLSEKQAIGIRKIVQEKKVTLFSFFLSAYYILLSKLSGQRDIVVGTAASGRRLQSLEDIVGMFINTLALRAKVNPHVPFEDFLHQVQKDTMEALENQDLPFEEVVRQLKLPRTKRNPLFNVMLVFQNMDIGQEEVTDFSVAAYPFIQETSKFDLTLFVREINNIIYFKLEYSAQLFYEEQVSRFMKYFSEIITALLEDPTVRIGNILLSHDLEEAAGGDTKIEFNF